MAETKPDDIYNLDMIGPDKFSGKFTVNCTEDEFQAFVDQFMDEVNGINRGIWVKLDGQMLPPELHGKHRCSRCRNLAGDRHGREFLSDYCPFCGAQMYERLEDAK